MVIVTIPDAGTGSHHHDVDRVFDVEGPAVMRSLV
jgi:hypothetical protein